MQSASMSNINQIYEKYSNSKISANIKYDTSTIEKEDINIIENSNKSKPNGPNYWKDFYFKELPYKIKNYFEIATKPSQKISDIDVKVSKDTSKESNGVNINAKFDYNNLFLSPFDYFYLYRSNSYIAKLNYIMYNKRFPPDSTAKQRAINENEISCGILYNASKDKKTYFANNATYFLNDAYKILSSIKFSKNDFLYENGFKVQFIKNLGTKPSFIFREYLPFDPINRLCFQISQKSINNLNSKDNSLIPEHDSHLRAKLSYEENNLDITKFQNYNLKVSFSLIKSLNSLFLKNKIFLRKIFDFDNFNYQLNAEVSNIKSLTDKNVNDFNLNEKIYINNFRGIAFPSRMDNNGPSINYGNTFYALVKNKLYCTGIPFFNKFKVESDGFSVKPFLQFNMLYNPKQEIDNSLHLSTGLGLSFILRICAFEFNFLPFVKSNSNEIKSKFSFTLGLD